MKPLDPFSFVVDEQRKWTPDWYQWIQDLSGTVTPGTPNSVIPWVKFVNPVSLKAGFNVGAFDGTRLYANGGTITGVDNAIYSTDQTGLGLCLDVSITGIRQWSGIPNPPPALQQVLFTNLLGGMLGARAVHGDPIYLILVARNEGEPKDSTPPNTLVLMGSTQFDYGYVNANIPSGWHAVRFLPFAVRYLVNNGANWNGLPNFFTDAQAGSQVILPGLSFDGHYLLGGAVVGGTGTSAFGTISAANLVVSPCLTLLLNYHIGMNPANVIGGTASLTTVGEVPWPLGQVLTVNDNIYGETMIRTDTSQGLSWSTTGGAQIGLYLKGWQFDEPF